MKIFVDIDDTICFYKKEEGTKMDYSKAIPYLERINKINKLYDEGHKIIYWTARGSVTQKLWFNITYEQLKSWKCKFHELRMGKPAYDLFIDDKNINSNTYFE
uniref:FCP1 homology domain-containing protein n=1 Tax=viral metagenome TaxID=1070528 RepID=A0A6C0LXH7_9ZZZZ